MIPEVNIITGKASVASVNGGGGFGARSESLSGGFRPQGKFLGSKEHLQSWS